MLRFPKLGKGIFCVCRLLRAFDPVILPLKPYMKHIAVSIQYLQTMCHANMLVPIYVHFSCLVTAELESVLVLSQLNCVETPTRISAHNSCCGLYKISFQLIFHLFSLECKNAKTAQKSSHNFHLWPVLYLCATLVRIG